jgi:hypothetical protein
MLSSLLSEHAARAASRREVQEKRRKEACAAASALTGALVDHLNVGVAQAYLNQKRLDAEAKRLHSHAAEFAKQTHAWINLVDSFNSSLKDLGDCQSWAASIERDLKVVTSALEYTYKVNKEASTALQQQQQQQQQTQPQP